MKKKKKEKEGGLIRSIFIAHLIVLLHIVLLAGAGLTVMLFKGVYDYLPWIMGGIGILLLFTAWFFYRQFRAGSSDIQTVLSMPQFKDRAVEIKLAGGLATFKLDAPKQTAIQIGQSDPAGRDPVLLEHNTRRTEEKLYTLNSLFEKKLITKEEFEKAKQELFQG